MFKKVNLKKMAVVAVAVTGTVCGITFMTVTGSAQAKTASEASSYNSPSAGLSTQTLLSAISTDEISIDFVSVSSVAAENIQQKEADITQINETITEIETLVSEASENAQNYSEADEAYQTACEVLEEAQSFLEAATESDSSVLTGMYAQDVETLLEEAKAAADEAQSQAEAAEAAKEAQAQAEKEAAEKAAKEAAEKAAAEKAAKEAAEKAEQEAAAAAAAASESSSSDSSSSSQSSQTTAETTESSDADAIRQALVSYAKSFAGVLKYKSGGSSLSSGVDCSGFTQAIYAAYGYSLSRTSSGQASNGRAVSLSEIEIGDLVCYSGHVGIYIGNGQIVHAPGSGRYVTISSIDIMTIKSIRRIIE